MTVFGDKALKEAIKLKRGRDPVGKGDQFPSLGGRTENWKGKTDAQTHAGKKSMRIPEPFV